MSATSSVPRAATPTRAIRFSVNGRAVEHIGSGARRLVDVLRVDLGLSGTKEGCGEGECGACSVLLDGDLVAACLVPVCQAEGRDVRTVEGLGASDALDPIQDAFLEAGAVQCGFCTPGMLLAAEAFLASGAEPTDQAIRTAIAGNLCRCTGYVRIVDAIARAARERPGDGGRGVPAATSATAPHRVVAASFAERHVESPASLDDALRLLAGGLCRPIAGGTDVMVVIAPGGPGPDRFLGDATLLDLSRLDTLRGIRLHAERIVVGPLATYTEIRRSPIVQEHLPALAEVAASVGAVQVQNRGTIGGNVATASPAGDMLPLLLATDATFVLASVRGEREVSAADFFVGYRRTALSPDELIVRILVPLPPGREVRFHKVGTRRAQAISKVAIAVSWQLVDGVRRDVRVAAGSVASVPVRCRGAEAALEGTAAGEASVRLAAAALQSDIDPIDDVRSTARYRRVVAGRVLRRLLS